MSTSVQTVETEVQQSNQRQPTAVDAPDSHALHRLAVAAGKYLDKAVGEPLPTREIVRQGEANGYAEHEVRAMLDREGIEAGDRLRVPPQGMAFGELWRSPCRRTPHAHFSPERRAFDEWLREKRERQVTEYEDGYHQHRVTHSYSLHTARERLARAKDVDRHFIEEHEHFTTVMVTYCAERDPTEAIHEHAGKFYPTKLSKTRWNLFNRHLDTDEWAGVRILAPGKPAEHTPHPDFTHAHSIYWLAGHHEREDFERLRDTFLSEVDGATESRNPLDDMITVRQHTSAEVREHESVEADSLDAQRGPTTSASGEVGANLPVLRARNSLREGETTPADWARADASDCPDWIQAWCAHIRCNGAPETVGQAGDRGGISRWGTFGDFDTIADNMHEVRGDECVKTGYGDQPEDGQTTVDGVVADESDDESSEPVFTITAETDEHESSEPVFTITAEGDDGSGEPVFTITAEGDDGSGDSAVT